MRYDPPPINTQGGPIATSDRSQFAHDLFDRHAEEVYHYVLAWTGDQASAVDLTTTVLRTAVARMGQLAEGADAAELEMRLIALVRAAVTRWRARRPDVQRPATAVPEESMPLFEALGGLDDDRREVLTLVALLGQEPEHAGRLLGHDAKAVEAQRDEALESLWRAMNDAPPDQAVSTWDRLTVDTALRRAAGGWIPSAQAVLGYLGEQLFGEAPVGVPAAAPARGTAAKARGTAAPARGTAAKARGTAEVAPGQDGQHAPWRAIAGLILLLRGRWAAWGIAAAAAAGLGVIAALIIGGPVSGSSQCATPLACPPSTTAAGSGNAGEVLPAPTDGSGDGSPTTTRGSGVFGPAQEFPFSRSTSTTTGRSTTTTRRVTSTTSPPRTTRPGPTSSATTQTTLPPTTAPQTSDTTLPAL